MDYRVDLHQLDAAAHTVEGLADVAASAMSTMRLDLIASAIPGSISAGRATAIDAQWVSNAETIAHSLGFHADAMQQTATNYRAMEDAAQHSIDDFFGRLE